ncbi:single-stranded DNA-binding protein [Curtobacterium sp. MCSS17_007]|uniref:single-stranded DNA-binding protein n=1 Tax=Curtobacterium sp. MCSS17_007 TaxID=2175646 RepID=UPI000DA95F8F|nr:single-stranded DNA-binding protein [Curtobacterium sp. MCSS17_007]WIE76542.1 single-stranded DNA-binding protein [Curtobacterium sp. MCSS17_007]
MNDTITVCGIVATEPRYLVTDTGIAISSMRLASPSRRWDRASSSWTNGTTNWFTVTAFRSLAANVHKSLKKGDRIVVTGRVRIRTWERDGRGGTSVEIDAEGIGHDLAWGISNWIRVPRHSSESSAVPGDSQTVDPRTGEVRGSTGAEHRTTHPREDGSAYGLAAEPTVGDGGDGVDAVGGTGEELPDPAEAARHTAALLGGDFTPPASPPAEDGEPTTASGREAA